MSLTPPPPPPPHRPSSGASSTGCRSSFGTGKPKNGPASPSLLAITTPPLSRVRTARQGPLPSSLPDAARLREILVDITEETNNGHGLRRHATIGARPVAPRVFASLGPVTRSRSLVALPTPSRSRTHTPSIGGADENLPGTDSPAARLVLSRASQTPSTAFQPQPFYTPSPLGHRPRTVARIEPLRIFPQPWSQLDSQSQSPLPSLSLPTPSPSDVSVEPRLETRRRRRSVELEDDHSPSLSTTATPAVLQSEPPVRRLRRVREVSAATTTSTALGQADPKRRKRNSTSSTGLGRL